MSARRVALSALIALICVHIGCTVVALAAYSHRIGLVTHDGSGFLVELLDAVVTLRDLLPAVLWLLPLTLLVTFAALGRWAARRTVRPDDERLPAAAWTAGVAAALLNPLAAVRYASATAEGGEYMRTVQVETTLLVLAAAVATTISALAVAGFVRRSDTASPASRRYSSSNSRRAG
ncbi:MULTISPECIES: hypothetical protein [unclassified Micromonospora]|uniref:hypothetical protein n=1 Tax=unclassified Micromonospora TaxID=2617518 RepID=UPI001C223F32|nr:MULTISPECIES: hypothetical protein [unclassified Micromonospora]MBU8859824.1 hypothetical protein [Micromonospora sp. WMMB482]MDM4779345.1 hypothetical protein [Micromonospora sp. b486]